MGGVSNYSLQAKCENESLTYIFHTSSKVLIFNLIFPVVLCLLTGITALFAPHIDPTMFEIFF